jgi:Rps23 Pro-64 3,4-dihydroxylase Tpa1-like proline 4-hydroxylase
MDEIALNPDLDPDALAEAFAEKKRLQIKKIFPRDTALAIHDVLANHTPWQYTYFDGTGTAYKSLEEMREMPPRARAEFAQALAHNSRNGFSFAYNTFNFHHEIEKGNYLDHPLKAFDDFMNGEAFLSFAKHVTGDDTIQSAGAAATWYGPGHYLNLHVDKLPGWDLRAAFIFYFCPTWKPDWGGELKFFPDKRGTYVEEAFFPAFNTMNIMALPKYHSVGVVAPFAGAPRLAISGWLYAGETPYSVDELP